MNSNTRILSLTALGTILEWAEYCFYGYMAVTISKHFFPNHSHVVAVLNSFGVFAIGYVMRPLGAICFGYIGDKIGRKVAIVYSMLLMGFSTFGMGCLPTYEQIGILAPILLYMLRAFQGLAVSGEFNGAAIFLIEKDIHPNRPCLSGSWISAAAACGMVLGGLTAFGLSLSDNPNAWRFGFYLGGISCFVGYFLRKKIAESEVFISAKKLSPLKQAPLVLALKHHGSGLIFTAAIAAFTGIFVYIGNVFVVVFLQQHTSIPPQQAPFFAIIGEIVVMLGIPLAALWADRHKQALKQYQISLVLISLYTPIMFWLILSSNKLLILIAMLGYGVCNALMCGPIMKLIFDRFPVQIRYSSISFAWSISAAIFSGTAPLLAQYLIHKWQFNLGPSFYVALMGIVTLILTLKFDKPQPNSHIL